VVVLAGRRIAGELVDGLGDARQLPAGGGDAGETVVHLGPPLEHRHGLGKDGVGGLQLLRGGPLARVQTGIGQRDPRLLDEHRQQELLRAGGLPLGADHHVAVVALEPAQGERPAPAPAEAGDLPARGADRLQALLEVRAGAVGEAGARAALPPPRVEQVDAVQPPGAE
jgi:hypothetical protein